MKNFTFQRGQAMLVSVVFLVLISVIIVEGFATPLARELKTARVLISSRQSYYAAESGVEDALYRIKSSWTPSSPYSLTVGTASTNVVVDNDGQDKTITATGDSLNHNRLVSSVVNTSDVGVDFFYGLQVDDGGIDMNNSSQINGSVYSNGDIIGANSPTITVNATVAGGLNPVDTEWIMGAVDYKVGTYDGTMVSTIDSTNVVGRYSSIALGSDGFARVAYYDDTTRDLKFARCLDSSCTTKNITSVDTAGDVGQYASLVVGSDGFARIAYYDLTNTNLKFARCTNADCSSGTSIVAVDSTNDQGKYASLKIGTDGFPRIAYYDDTADDLKFARCVNVGCTGFLTTVLTIVDGTGVNVGSYVSLALDASNFGMISYVDTTNADLKYARCTNANCSTANKSALNTNNISFNTSIILGGGIPRISYYDNGNKDLRLMTCGDVDCTLLLRKDQAVDTTGDVGQYSFLVLGSDGFARIVYYDLTNTNLKFVQCTNGDCSVSSVVTIDDYSTVGAYPAMILGSDGFAHITHYEDSGDDLRYFHCISDPCSLPLNQTDVAQSFQPTTTGTLQRVSLYLKKVGNPAPATMRIVSNSSGHPNSAASLTTATISEVNVGTSYSWINPTLASTPSLISGTTYWIVIDMPTISETDYYVWRAGIQGGYALGVSEYSSSYSSGAGSWSAGVGDLNFGIYIGGKNRRVERVTIGDATSGTGYANEFVLVTAHGAACPNAYCVIDNPPRAELPISAGVIQDWRELAIAGGDCVQPVCDASGNLTVDSGSTVFMGPKHITGNLSMPNHGALELTGTLYVEGNVTLSNSCNVHLSPAYGANSGFIVVDGTISVSNNCFFRGSGTAGSYVMLLSDKLDLTGNVINVSSGAVTDEIIYYASQGLINFSNSSAAKQVTAYGITMSNSATITYESGLANVNFTSGPGGSFDITQWQETQ